MATRRHRSCWAPTSTRNFNGGRPDKAITAEAVTRAACRGQGTLRSLPRRHGLRGSCACRWTARGKQPRAPSCSPAAALADGPRPFAQFACNFFACAGIRVQDNTFFKSVEEGVKAALESKAEIVVVCASDDDYAEVAPKVKELLGGKAILVIAGAPACTPELEAQGITNFINVKSNVLETLKFYLKEMGI